MKADDQKPIRTGDPVWIKDAFGKWHPSVARSGLTMSAGPGALWSCYLVDWDRPRSGSSGLVPRCNWPATHVVARTGQRPPLPVGKDAEDPADHGGDVRRPGQVEPGLAEPGLAPESDGGVEQVHHGDHLE